MTILETFIKLRDDLKTWVTNNLNQKANISYVDEKFDSISEFDPTDIQNSVNANAAAIDTKVDKVEGMGLSTNDYTTAEKDKLAEIEANANFYEHPVHTSHSSGLYKVTVDESGHVSGATLVEKEDIVALGVPAQDTTYEEEIEDLSGRLDDVENDISVIINETLNDLAQDFESYKTTNNEAVSTNASGIEANKTAIEEIQGDYLKSTDKTQLQDGINEVSEKATANASAIEILNGEGDGSVKQSIDNAFNEFAANVTNDDVVNTYKELIDYAAEHGPEFTELVGKVDTINTHVGEIEVDLSNYKTAVSDQFTEVDTAINNHVTDTNNPHGVTKEQVGLANVDNTSDIEKPISNAVQEALDDKANLEHAHSDLYYDKDEIEELVTVEDIDDICGSNVIIGGGDATVVSYATKQWVQDGYQPKGNYLTSVPDGYATESYVNTKIAAIPTPDVSGQINTHNLATDAHNDIRLLVDGLAARLNTLADCDDTTLDQMSEVVDYIKNNQSLIEGVTTKKVNVADIIDNLTTNVSNKPLSAAQGVVLNGLIEELTSNLSNYQPKGDYLTAVPAGYATEEFVTAKIAEAELGGEEVDLSEYVTESEMQNYAQPKGDYLTSIPAEYITEKELENKGYLTEHQNLSDYATKKELPTKTSDLINDSGFLTTNSVESVNGQTGAVVLDAASVGARPNTWMPSASDVGALPDTTAIPIVPDNISAFANDAGYLTEHQSLEGLATEEWVEEKFEEHSGFVAQPEAPEDINVLWLDTDDNNAVSGGNVDQEQITAAVNEALAEAKASGEFNGKDGVDGKDYVLTDGDRTDIAALVIEMLGGNPIFGIVDENNNIIVSGDLPDGTYSVKYEMEDGSTVDIGELSLIPDIPDVMVNLLETAYDTDLETAYNGIGWKANTRVKSDGTLTTGSKCILTGFIPFVSTDDVFHIRGVEGINYLSGSDRGSIAFYGDGLTFLKSDSWIAGDNDEFGDFTIPLNSIASKIPAETKYMRFHLGSATGDVIMTRNQLITV